jgi:TP901 family phage tail tape measure protein
MPAAAGSLATAFVMIRANAKGFASDLDSQLKAASKSAGVAGDAAGTSFSSSLGSKLDGATKAISKFGVAAAAGALVASVDMAAKFQEGLTSLVTGAGESEKNLKLVGDGIKSIAVTTGTTTSQLINGMFMIESAGYHGAAGLLVLKAASEGAKVGGADLGTVADAVTTVLKDYSLGAGHATGATDALVAIVSSGKTHMQDLASSVSKVLPTAAALHVGLGEVGGAMATMTSEGTSAKLAAMGLNTTLISMAAPNATAIKEMASLGLGAHQVADTLTHKGLVAALEMVTDAAGKKFPPGSAAYVDALNKMLGGHRGLQVALELTGKHLGTLKTDTASVSAAMSKGSGTVTGFGDVTHDFSFKMDVLKEILETTGISVGQKLLPPLESFLGWLSKSNLIIPAIAGALGVVAAALLYQGVLYGITAVKGIAAVAKLILSAVSYAAAWAGSLAATVAAWLISTGIVESSSAAMMLATGGIVLVLAALVVGAYELYKHWGTVWAFCKAVVVDLWHWIESQWSQLLAMLWDPIKTAAANIVSAWNTITAGIKTVFDWITYNWHLVLIILTGPIGLAVDAIQMHWKTIMTALQAVISWIATAWDTVTGFLAKPVKAGIDLIKGYFDTEWAAVKTILGWFQTGWDAVTSFLAKPVNAAIVLIKSYFDATLAEIKVILGWFDTGWKAVQGYLTAPVDAAVKLIQTGWNTMLAGLKTLGTDIKAAWNDTIGWLVTAGGNLITGLFNGAIAKVKGAVSWAAQIGGEIVTAVKSFFGIHSPSTVMAGIGGNLMSGLVSGMVKSNPVGMVTKIFGSMPKALAAIVGKGLVDVASLPGKALSAIGSLLGSIFGGSGSANTSGVQQWASTVATALKMIGLPASYLNDVLNQMTSESGGNTQAVNRTDINWQEGHPSVGLMQVIQGTFDEWAGPFKGTGPFLYGVSTNPLANIYAALEYAAHGAGFGTGVGQIGSMHGYGLGGIIAEPIRGVGLKSGHSYMFGEHGPETVTPGTHAYGGGGDTGHLRQIVNLLTEMNTSAPGRHADALTDALNGVAHQAARRGMYSNRRS